MAANNKKIVKKTVAPAWNTIHIFGYGETQVIGNTTTGKVANDQLTTLAPLFAYLASKQRKDTNITLKNTRSLNIHNGSLADYRPRGANDNGQEFPWSTIDAGIINQLADELISKAIARSPRKINERFLNSEMLMGKIDAAVDDRKQVNIDTEHSFYSCDLLSKFVT